MKIIVFLLLATYYSPYIAYAAPGTNLFSLFTFAFELIAKLQSLFWVFAIGLFFWGLVKFIYHSSDSAEHENGKQYMVWGIIVFFVLFSIWGIVELLGDSLGIDTINSLDYQGKG